MSINIQSINTSEWRIDEFDKIVDEFEDSISRALNNHTRTYSAYSNLVAYMAGKTIVTIREILTLATLGYPDGALSLARNIYEQFIILSFFESHKYDSDFNDYLDDYITDYSIQRCKALKWYYRQFDDCAQKVEEIEHDYRNAKDTANHNISGDYWWTGHKCFSDVVNTIIQSSDNKNKPFYCLLHIVYKRACATLHASCFGNANRLGIDNNYNGIDTSPLEQGFGIPLWFATSSFILIAGISCNIFGVDFSDYKTKLNELALFYNNRRKEEMREA